MLALARTRGAAAAPARLSSPLLARLQSAGESWGAPGNAPGHPRPLAGVAASSPACPGQSSPASLTED